MSTEEQKRRTRADAEVEDLVRVLRSFDVLTREALCERAGGSNWPDHQFEFVLKLAISQGRIRKLADGLYELGEAERER